MTTLDFGGRVAVVTGAGRGIGRIYGALPEVGRVVLTGSTAMFGMPTTSATPPHMSHLFGKESSR
jgi:acyl-CoA reductase-like NAD-dependent aldehyde dehydrogenase